MTDLTLTELIKKYGDDDTARSFLESVRWPNGAICPRCQTKQDHKLTAQKDSKHPVRNGVYYCSKCRKQFTVTVKTIMERSHLPLGTWLAAIFLICASKKAISSLQLKRMLGIGSYETAWFMSHRIRHAMDSNANEPLLSGIVEADEAYVGGKPRKWGKKSKAGRGTNKTPVVVLVERNGRAKTKVMPDVNRKNLRSMLVKNVNIDSKIMTDESNLYNTVGVYFKGGHETVNHSKWEFARGDAHNNTAESFFALLKRGIYGTFHNVSKAHLDRYCNEFAFRWNNRKISDSERMSKVIELIAGKRLMYSD
ncbi:MAG: IS1595 family transposase [Bacteroidota bacterium]|jgi:transposase-like protein